MFEVYYTSENSSLVVENLKTGEVSTIKNMGQAFHRNMDTAIETQYPTTYKLLCNEHGATKEFAYARVNAFCACNFSVKDGRPDIDEDWNFKVENVPCPARTRGICKGEFCNPVISNQFTEREKEVLSLFVKGLKRETIAAHLFIAERTVGNHVANMYKKIPIPEGTNPEIALVNYAYAKKIV